MARKLIEVASNLIRDAIDSGIGPALSAVSTDRADFEVTTEKPQEYFFYEHSWALKTPSVFIIAVGQDFRQSEKQSNSINAKDLFNVSIVVEDRAAELAVVKSFRYQTAIHQVLDQAVLTSPDNALRLVVVVKSARFSPIYSQAKSENSTDAAFRREIYLECEVEHYESY